MGHLNLMRNGRRAPLLKKGANSGQTPMQLGKLERAAYLDLSIPQPRPKGMELCHRVDGAINAALDLRSYVFKINQRDKIF